MVGYYENEEKQEFTRGMRRELYRAINDNSDGIGTLKEQIKYLQKRIEDLESQLLDVAGYNEP